MAPSLPGRPHRTARGDPYDEYGHLASASIPVPRDLLWSRLGRSARSRLEVTMAATRRLVHQQLNADIESSGVEQTGDRLDVEGRPIEIPKLVARQPPE
jgi:hypothetical protein